MALRRVEIAHFPIPFRHSFAHASATRTAAANIVACAVSDSGVIGYGEGCPRPYVTEETTAGARAFLRAVAPDIARGAAGVRALRAWAGERAPEIDRNPAAFCALELALLDMMARERGLSLEALLGLPPLSRAHRYSAIIGDASPADCWRLWLRYRMFGLADFKVKLSGDLGRDRARLSMFRLIGAGRVRLDANNLWRDAGDCIAYLRGLRTSIFAIEEPLAANDLAGLRKVGQATGLAVILDESFLSADVLGGLSEDVRWILNVRVSKLGGLLRALDAVEAARRRGIGIVVGAHVGETGLLTRAALPVAHAAGPALVAQEGAFGTYLLDRDLTEPSIRFGYGGAIAARRLPRARSPGLGLDVHRDLLVDVAHVDVSGGGPALQRSGGVD